MEGRCTLEPVREMCINVVYQQQEDQEQKTNQSKVENSEQEQEAICIY